MFEISVKNVPYNKNMKVDYEKESMSGTEYMIRQEIPVIGKIGTMSKIEFLEAEIEKIRYLENKNQFIKDLSINILDYYYNQQIIDFSKTV